MTKVNKSNLLEAIMRYKDGDPTNEEVLELFSYLIKTGKKLSGLYKQQADEFIDNNIITKSGKINWNNYSPAASATNR